MNTVDWSSFKTRCSAISKILSNSRSNPQLTELQAAKLAEFRAKLNAGGAFSEAQNRDYFTLLAKEQNSTKVILSDTCIDYLMDVYAWETEGMIPVGKESLEVLAMEKGKQGEKEAGILLSIYDSMEYKVHKDRISNDYLTGEVDLFIGKHIYAATNVTDIKNAWDYPTFLKKTVKGLENGQTEQLQGYGDITGAKDLFIANTLVSATEQMIIDMQFKVMRKINCATTESPEFLEEWPKWEKSMRFDHMPAWKRVHKIKIEPFTPFEQQQVYDRVKVCREWLFNYDEQRKKHAA